MKCKCGNEARYINQDGEFCCSLCPIKDKKDAIRISDVPVLLKWARESLQALPYWASEELRSIIGKDTSNA